jgi:predicted ATP-dependent endonuclease of OLD family
MRIKTVKLQNFLSFGTEPQEFSFSSENVIVGPNGAGKTNVFRAIQLAGEILHERYTLPGIYHHNFDYKSPFEIEIKLEFDDLEKQALTNYLVCSCLNETVNVDRDERQEVAYELIKNLITKNGKRYFLEFCKEIAVVVRSEGRTIYRPELFLKIHANGKELFYFSYSLTKKMSYHGSYSVYNFPRLLLDELKSKFPDLLPEYLKDRDRPMPDLEKLREIPPSAYDFVYEKLDESGSSRLDFRGFRLDEFEQKYRQDFPEIFELREFVKERGGKDTDGYSYLSLIGLIFNSSIIKTENIRSKPKSTLSSLKSENETGIISIDGSNMASTLFSLRNNEDPRQKARYNQIFSEFEKLTGYGVDVILREVSQPTKKEELVFLPHKTEPFATDETRVLGIRQSSVDAIQYEILIQIIKNGVPIPIEFAAAGIFEMLLILTALIGYQNKVLLLDEPALNLHPTSQRRILQLIDEAVSQNQNQVIMITHSPFLIKSEKFEHIWKISPTSTGSKVLNLGEVLKELSVEDKKKIIKNLGNSDVRSILFQNGVVFVEGLTDKIVIEKVDQFFTERHGKGANLEENEWAIVELGGKKSAIPYIKLAQKLELPHFTVFDYDALMHCEYKISNENRQIRTSTIPFIIEQTSGFTKKELDNLALLEKKTEEIEIKKDNNSKPQRQLWYQSDAIDELKQIANSHNIFVFTSDIEGAMQNPVTKRGSKPLHAIDRVNQLIKEGRMPAEFNKLEISLEKIVKDVAKNHVKELKEKIQEQKKKVGVL